MFREAVYWVRQTEMMSHETVNGGEKQSQVTLTVSIISESSERG